MRTIMMEVTIHVPADIAARWQSQGDLPRDVLEGAALGVVSLDSVYK
jgi:hypothetical protein